jgi:hypothetical protein
MPVLAIIERRGTHSLPQRGAPLPLLE